LDYLAVHPENKGRGIGTALVQNGMREAENLGLDVFIHAYQAGLELYKRLGFYIEREFMFNDSKYGGPGNYSVYLMIYEQRTKQKE
jgi:ribosomal protein S18 acetylase RimI-like enzyme